MMGFTSEELADIQFGLYWICIRRDCRITGSHEIFQSFLARCAEWLERYLAFIKYLAYKFEQEEQSEFI